MTTELMLIGMDFQRRFNAYLGSFPIEWDNSTQQYTYQRHWKKLKFYYFCIVFLLCTVDLVCVLTVLILRWYIQPDPRFTMGHSIMFCLGISVAFFILGIVLAVFVVGHDGVIALNALINHLKNLRELRANKGDRQGRKKYTSDTRGLRKKVFDLCHDPEANGALDILGMSIVYFASYSLWFHYMVGLGLAIFDVNPIWQFGNAFLGDKIMMLWKVRIPAFFFYVFIFTLLAAQGIRLFQVIVILFVIPLQFYMKIMLHLNLLYDECKTRKDYDKHLIQYTKVQLINMFTIPPVDNQSFIMTTTARVICVMCLFIAIKLNSYVPTFAVIGASCGVLAIISFINLILPNTARLVDTSSESIAAWQFGLLRTDKYLLKKYKALRFLRFYSGVGGFKFFMLDRSSTSEFWLGVLEPTIDLMIGYPNADIKAIFEGTQI